MVYYTVYGRRQGTVRRQRANLNASPVYAAGNIYFFSIRGEGIVIKPGRKSDIVAGNQLSDQIWATPAFVSNAMILT